MIGPATMAKNGTVRAQSRARARVASHASARHQRISGNAAANEAMLSRMSGKKASPAGLRPTPRL